MKVGSVPMYIAVRSAFRALFALTGGIRYIGRENVPETGGLIVCSNHMSHLDPPALACAMPRRRLLAMAKEELFHNKAFGWLIAKIGAFPVHRGEADTESIRKAMAYLEDGQTMIVFPEGTRGDGIHFQHIERGTAMLAKKTGVPVLPVGIHGTQVVLPSHGGKKGRHRITVAVGKPFTYSEVATGKNEKENRELFSQALQDRILEQCRLAGLEMIPPQCEVKTGV